MTVKISIIKDNVYRGDKDKDRWAWYVIFASIVITILILVS